MIVDAKMLRGFQTIVQMRTSIIARMSHPLVSLNLHNRLAEKGLFPSTLGAKKNQAPEHLVATIEPANGRVAFPVIEPARYAGSHENFHVKCTKHLKGSEQLVR